VIRWKKVPFVKSSILPLPDDDDDDDGDGDSDDNGDDDDDGDDGHGDNHDNNKYGPCASSHIISQGFSHVIAAEAAMVRSCDPFL